ncbi:GNAT family N-acetyltransferase [Micromonospora rubida]|uniref:GNAT family N-acetyltransferase n=1 Tax=Micromonospora rubida TaxID=2697657 RepID=UPI001378D9BA|nr:GNAT family N-acetyltransferase [Micromonospora rubida]NBE79815.1 GNAT family N-acetyltransferase [Micromonospora rubida]
MSAPPSPPVTFQLAESPADRAAVLRLRDEVYVRDQGRLLDATDTEATFDRFDPYAHYILAVAGDRAVGTVKVIPDQEAGLPCEDVVDLGALRPGHRLVEFGHLMTLPTIRNQSIGMGLMREALVHSVSRFAATHVIGDFFVDGESGRLRDFYLELGFVPLGEPYPDERFAGSPLSAVAYLDLPAAVRLSRTGPGRQNRLLQYFFADYDSYAGAR